MNNPEEAATKAFFISRSMVKAAKYSKAERFRHTAQRTLHRAVKKAKVFEVKKALRRCKEQPSEERSKRVEKLKGLDVDTLASVALSRFLQEEEETIDDAGNIVLSAGPVRAANSLLADKRRLKRKADPVAAEVGDEQQRRDTAFLSSLSNPKKKKKTSSNIVKKKPPVSREKPPLQQKQQQQQKPPRRSPPPARQNESLHASWAAARLKKQQESVLVPFQGKKVTFS